MTLSRIARLGSAPLALLLVVLPVTVRGDLDKEDLKKKEEREAAPSLGGEQDGDFYKDLVREGEKNLREIEELLEKIQNDLANKSTGGGTQQKQQQAVEKLERLITEIAKASQQQSSSSSSSQEQQQKQQKQQQGQQQKQQQRQDQKEMDARQMEADQKQQSEKERNDQQNREHERVEKPQAPESEKGSLVARLRQNRRWGLLPPKVTEALASGDKEPPAEYQEIIARYYKRMTDYQARKN